MKPLHQEKTQMPVFDSMSSCSGATGIPSSAIKAAKRAGCDAFKGSRIFLAPLLRWLFSDAAEDAGVNWNEELTKAKTARERLRLSKERNEILDRVEAEYAIRKVMAVFWQSRDRFDRVELPAALKGLTEAEIETRLLAATAAHKAAFVAGISTLFPPEKAGEETEK